MPREREITSEFREITIAAISDPHIERWMLIDSAAFKKVLGKGCSAPDRKCQRDRFKELLRSAIRGAGISPLLGGMEYAEDIVNAMDLQRMEQTEPSFGKMLRELNAWLKGWSEEQSSCTDDNAADI